MSRCLALLLLTSCATWQPSEPWTTAKRARLESCKRTVVVERQPSSAELLDALLPVADPGPTVDDAEQCLGRYVQHRGTTACTDAAAWVARVRHQLPE